MTIYFRNDDIVIFN